MNHSHNEQGFTLLELLIVCLLISISLALAVPNLRNSLVTDELASGSRKVISLLKSCRARAMSRHKAFFVRYDVIEGKLWCEPAESTDETAITHLTITLPPGVQIRGVKQKTVINNKALNQNNIWISEQGYMDQTAIELVDNDNSLLSILISPFLPAIKVIEGSVDQ